MTPVPRAAAAPAPPGSSQGSSLAPGDHAPDFVARCTANERFYFHTVAGRYVVLTFFGSAAPAETRQLLATITARRDLFDDQRCAWFGVSSDPADEAQARVPGYRVFWDFDGAVARRYGALVTIGDAHLYACFSLVLDPSLRILARFAGDGHADLLLAFLAGLPEVDAHAGAPLFAPVLLLPRVFGPDLCRALIDYYEAQGGKASGFMREQGGRTVGVHDHSFKRRADAAIEDEALRVATRRCIETRIRPAVWRYFSFDASRIERYLVACYDGADGGFFRPHRDNTTKGTAHRRFAVTINLNAEDYDGGDLRFPEFGHRTYRAPTGGAIVFSCGMLHEARPVTRGRRFAFLPFLYDDASAEVRRRNIQFIDSSATP